MDAKFQPAMQAILSGDLEQLRSLISTQPELATERSSKSHPTLLQFLVLDAKELPNQIEMAKVLIEAGADVDEPLIAAASGDNAAAVVALIEAGAAINGNGEWSPMEEALYWVHKQVAELLVNRGASIHNLRIAAGLGRVDLIESFFTDDGRVTGRISSPFRGLREREGAGSAQDVLNNALIYACTNDRIEAVRVLLSKGADVNAIPPGFDYNGTALHNAALHGHRAVVDVLLDHGADLNIKDGKVNQTAAGWAAYSGHKELAEYLNERAAAPV